MTVLLDLCTGQSRSSQVSHNGWRCSRSWRGHNAWWSYMRYRYFVDFRHCVSVFTNFSHSIAVLGTPNITLGIKIRLHTSAMMHFPALILQVPRKINFRVPKTLTFKMRLGAQMSLICMRMKNDFHIKGWAPTLVLKQRPGGTQKWPIFFLQ